MRQIEKDIYEVIQTLRRNREEMVDWRQENHSWCRKENKVEPEKTLHHHICERLDGRINEIDNAIELASGVLREVPPTQTVSEITGLVNCGCGGTPTVRIQSEEDGWTITATCHRCFIEVKYFYEGDGVGELKWLRETWNKAMGYR